MYCAIDDIQSRLEEPTLVGLADDDGDGAADPAVVAAAIADADAEIDAALGGRYSVPVDSPPALLRAISAWLAIAALFRRRRETPSPAHAEQAEHARALLAMLGEGRCFLPGVAAASAPASNRDAESKIFNADTLRNI